MTRTIRPSPEESRFLATHRDSNCDDRETTMIHHPNLSLSARWMTAVHTFE